jgi:predicted transcriptional regulator
MAISNRVELAAEIVAAFVSYNPVPKGDLPSLIEAVHSAVERLEKGPATAPPQIEAEGPAVPIRKSITPDFLISLEDGKPYQLLRRHLTRLGLTPAQYREKWNPAVGLSHGRRQLCGAGSELAKEFGPGQHGVKGRTRKTSGRPKAAGI